MRMSDVVGHAGLSAYAEVALVLFLIAFAAILVWTFAPSRRRELESRRALPFEGEPDGTHENGASS